MKTYRVIYRLEGQNIPLIIRGDHHVTLDDEIIFQTGHPATPTGWTGAFAFDQVQSITDITATAK